jgi:hypothetical protein
VAEYKKPGFMVNALNALVKVMNRAGISPQGSHTLVVKGRTSGKPRSMPVNPMEFQGSRYLVAPRGETHWVRNLRASGEADLSLRKTEHIRTEEVADNEKPAIILAYLDRWGGVTREHFGASSNHPDEAELGRLAARTPVFRIVSGAPAGT